MKNKLVHFLLLLIISGLAGCSAKLSDIKEAFSAQGMAFTFQLPSSWENDPKYQENYGQNAVFAAADTKSNSKMFISATRKDMMDLKDFGNKTRQQLSQTYDYKNVEDVYMKEFKLNEYPAYKYTVFTKLKEKEFWAHIYFIETQTGLVQLVYYSADDSNYENRAKIIDNSARSLVETKADEAYEETSTDQQKADVSDSVKVANDKYVFEIKGFRKIKGTNNEELLVIRFETTNNLETNILADIMKEVVKVTQNEQLLSETTLPSSETDTPLGLLETQKTQAVTKDQSAETILVYKLKKNSGEVILTFLPEQFPEQEPVILDLDLLKG
ncbi:DUF5067 domain-containing protein [Enterococcus sp. 5H]|uniref:DUF5067 domain-containing protein n=1 Tax=Enterococcus sp. 5H TaxID=1229490 RepID=UPI0023039290|nr:DUF5067 domain-containing protein [Enterococcus sp. 5H]MDA9470613.1 hypothetical protein [Enterococcus sp. 5H]